MMDVHRHPMATLGQSMAALRGAEAPGRLLQSGEQTAIKPAGADECEPHAFLPAAACCLWCC